MLREVGFICSKGNINFVMQSHPELHKGKFNSTFNSKKSKVLWQLIANELNSIVGATKEPLKSKKCWIYLKINVKTKSVRYKKRCRKTGGGDNENEKTDDWKDKILNLIGEVPVNGHPNTAEPVVNFEGFQTVVDTERLDESKDVLFYSLTEIEELAEHINREDISDINLLDQENRSHFNFDDPFTDVINDTKFAGKPMYVCCIDQSNLATDTSKSELGVLKQSVNASMHKVESNNARNEIKKSYYIATLFLLKRTEAKEKIAGALEKKYLM